jgi:hypothetical protein
MYKQKMVFNALAIWFLLHIGFVYGQVNSLYFDGSDDYLTISNSSNQFEATGDFTFEAWVNWSTLYSNSGQMSPLFGGQQYDYVALYNGSKTIRVDANGGCSGDRNFGSSSSISTGEWIHIAVVRSGSTITWYTDGVSSGTTSCANDWFGNGGTMYIGKNTWRSGYFHGYMTNIRYVDGTAVYTSNFTPPETVSNITNTTFMLVVATSGNYITDTSSNGYTVTAHNSGPTFNYDSDGSLPVELTSFNVLSTRNDAVTLQWVTESEINNLGFILDRRVPGTEWTEIATYITHPELQGQGSVTHQTIYSYTDNTVLSAETYDYRLADVDYDGNKVYHSMTVMGVSPNDVVPETFTLYPAYPNPFNPVTTIRFDIPEGAANLLSLRIFDINGGLVETLMDGQREPGIYTVQWDGSYQPSGVYFVRLESGSTVAVRKLILLK